MKQSPTKQSKYIGPSRKKGAAREVYGFVGWTTSFVVYGTSFPIFMSPSYISLSHSCFYIMGILTRQLASFDGNYILPRSVLHCFKRIYNNYQLVNQCYYRYWAISLPTYIIVAVGFGLVVYFCLNLISIAPLSSRETITGKHATFYER